MLLKYCIFNGTTPDMTEIADITKEGRNAIFTPIRVDILDIIVKDISGYEYERIVDMLFDYGKADITSLKNKTFYEEIDDYEKNDDFPMGDKEDKSNV